MNEFPDLDYKLRNILVVLFAVSGFSGLIYESIWTQYLKLFLGHAAYAQALVLAIFMGGMAIGSWLCSRYSLRLKNPLLGYAVLEGIIGICALAFHGAFVHAIKLAQESVIPWLGNDAVVSFFKWGLAALMILPQSALLGMTFPLMTAGILRLIPKRPGRSVALLYFSNSIGAAIGVLTSGFVLIKLAGLPGTINIAGYINLIIALTVWRLVRKSPHGEGPREATAVASSSRRGTVFLYRMFLSAALVTGAASFIYEIGWIRMLSLVLGTTTYAFELMLSAFIFGLSCGGLWIRRRIDGIDSPVRYLAQVQIVMGMLALATLALYGNTFEYMQWLRTTLPKTSAGFALFNVSCSAIAMAIMFPAAFCAGMTLPLITLVLLRQGHGERSIGAVYAANTVGAIAGVFFSLHLGMPQFGLKGLIIGGAGLDIALGITLFWLFAHEARSRTRAVVFAAIGVSAIVLAILFVRLDPYQMASGVYRVGYLMSHNDGTLLYHRDGKTATISCFLEGPGRMAIKTNGKTDASMMVTPGYAPTDDEATNILLGVLPMLYQPRTQTAATIGLGSGLTSQTLLSNPGLLHLDTVEIEKNMIEAAKNFRPRNELVYIDPRSTIYNDDARTYFATYKKKYDVIVSEPSAVWVSGLAGLFSEEFYRMIKQHLYDDGLFVQWLHLSEVDADMAASVLKAVSATFPDFVVYSSVDLDMVIIAKKQGIMPDPDYSVFNIPAIAVQLNRVHITSAQDMALRRIGNKKNFEKLLGTFPISANSDYYPVLDQRAAKAAYMVSLAGDLSSFGYYSFPVKELLSWSASRKEPTKITRSEFYEPAQASAVAMGLRDYYRRGSLASHDVPENLAQIAVELKRACAGTVLLSEDERLGRLYNLAIATVPYLSPEELEPMWKTVGSGACVALSSDRERLWRDLFKASGRRDAVLMLEAARTLLASEHDLPWQAHHYLLTAGMLGALAQGNRSESLRLWERYKSITLAGKEPDILFRLLAAESRD